MTPQEFNNIATQVQLQLLNEYFNDLNQGLRRPGNNSEYGDYVKGLEEKISIFQESLSTFNYSSGAFTPILGSNELYKLGTVTYANTSLKEVEVELVQPNELKQLQRSKLTAPSLTYPLYTYTQGKLYVYPTGSNGITSGISITYLRKPLPPVWGFILGSRGQYLYDAGPYNPGSPVSTGSRDFELDNGEQTNIILRVLMYAGIIIKDPSIVQVAAQQVQAEQINSKS